LISDSDFFSLVEAGSGLGDRLSGKYFVPLCVARREEGTDANHQSRTNKESASPIFSGDPWKNLLADTGLEKFAGPVRLRSRAQLPVWAREVRKMLAALAQTKTSHDKQSLLGLVCEPAVMYARRRLHEKLTAEMRDSFSRTASLTLEAQLRQRLSQTAKACFELHLNAFETAYTYVKGSFDRKALRVFAKDPAANLLDLLQSFPALARLWSQLITDWVFQVSELAKRLVRDRRAISKCFFCGHNPGRLIDLQLNLSDPHRGGREVIVFIFERGHVVYKPRNARAEHEWFELLHWLNRQGFSAKFRIPRMVRRKTHSWMEFIPSKPCKSEAAARRFYRRAGAITLAAYLMRAIDCHRGNLIASGEHPVLIDLETLMHNDIGLGAENLSLGIFRTGLLPVPKSAYLPRYEYSALAQPEPGPHTPTLNGETLPAVKYAREIISGFREAWNLTLIKKGRRRSLRRRLRRLKTRCWRHLYWPTYNYIATRDASITAAALRSGMERLRVLGERCARPSVSSSVILQEIISLERFDVPRFSKTADAEPQLPLALDISSATQQLRAALSRDD
jgi:lantibiotic modifying enzyme